MEAAKKNETKAVKPADAKANGKPRPTAGRDPAKGAALKAAIAQIEREFGQGSLMRLGDRAVVAGVDDPHRRAVDRPRARGRRRPARADHRDLRPRVLG